MFEMLKDLKKILLGQKRLNIRLRMMFIVLSVSIATLIILSGVLFYGMSGAKDMAINAGDEIGREALENSSEILEEQVKSELKKIALDKAEDINYRMKNLGDDVKIISEEMHEILTQPNRFLPQNVKYPNQISVGNVDFYIQHSQNFNRAAFENEIALQSNIQDIAIRVTEGNSMIDVMIIASKDNFTFSAEDNRNKSSADFKPSPIIYDALSSDWYKIAVDKKNLIFTNVRQFIFSKKLGLFCATPYFDLTEKLRA